MPLFHLNPMSRNGVTYGSSSKTLVSEVQKYMVRLD
jgi:hypothetical protein